MCLVAPLPKQTNPMDALSGTGAFRLTLETVSRRRRETLFAKRRDPARGGGSRLERTRNLRLTQTATPNHDIIKANVAEFMSVDDASRIGIQTASCSPTGDLLGTIQIHPTFKTTGGRRLESNDMDQLTRKLVESIETHPIQILKAGLVFPDEPNFQRGSAFSGCAILSQ